MYLNKIVFSLSIFFSLTLFAQQTFPIDSSSKKITYYDVVKVDSTLKKSILQLNAEKWVENNLKIEEIKSDSNKVLGSGNMVMTEMKSLLEKTTGFFTFDFMVEVKDGKYRYMFTNFVFHKYTYDRYGKVQNETKKRMEEEKAAGWNRLWNKHKATVDLRVRALVVNLKDYMKVNPFTMPVEQKMIKKGNDW